MSITDKGHAFIPRQTFTEGPSGFSPAPIDSYELTSSSHAVDCCRQISTLTTLVSCRNSLCVVCFCWSVDWLRTHCVDCVPVTGRSHSSSYGTGLTLHWWRPESGQRWRRPLRRWTGKPPVRYVAERVWTFPPFVSHQRTSGWKKPEAVWRHKIIRGLS